VTRILCFTLRVGRGWAFINRCGLGGSGGFVWSLAFPFGRFMQAKVQCGHE
jgi:hypothetical protein